MLKNHHGGTRMLKGELPIIISLIRGLLISSPKEPQMKIPIGPKNPIVVD